MKQFGYPVCMDCTHSVQRPGSFGGKTGGDRKFVSSMAFAAKSFGIDGYFMEVHPDPEKGLSDAANMLYLDEIDDLVNKILNIQK